jgi:hypothetical protein
MYESPIEIIKGNVHRTIECDIMRSVQEVGISVDKEELIRALKYDRGQYEKGYADGKRDGGKKNAARELLLDWAIECDFGYDNIPDEYEKYKDEIADMDYKEGLIYIAEREIEERDHSGCDDDACPIVFD